MKKIILFLLLIAATNQLQAQTFAEWFQQKKTQKKYLLQQIAALQAYIAYAQKGYQIAKEGLTNIGGLTNEEFNLHTGYINSLKSVNSEVKRYGKVQDIITLQEQIVHNYNRSVQKLKSSHALTDGELAYIGRVFDRLLDDCDKTLDELITISTNGKLEMTDDERVKRIDLLHLDMQDKFAFSQCFSNDAIALAASRLKENKDVQTSRVLHGIKNN